MTLKQRFGRPLSLAAMLFLVVACVAGTDRLADEAPGTGDEEPTATTATTASSVASAAGTDAATDRTAAEGAAPDVAAVLVALPVREGPRRETTHGVPHIQLDVEPAPAVDAEIRRRTYSLPGVEERESLLSLPGARSLWLADDVEVVRPEVLQAGREFGHFHPDGSLHLWLPVDRAIEVAETKWGELHPWVGREDFWDGLVMVYAPETLDEADITMRLIVDAYNHLTGSELDPDQFA